MSDLDHYRSEIDEIDEQIMKLMAHRQAQVIKIAHLKAKEGLRAYQPARHQEVVGSRKRQAEIYGLNPAMVVAIWHAIMDESIRIQEEVFHKKSASPER